MTRYIQNNQKTSSNKKSGYQELLGNLIFPMLNCWLKSLFWSVIRFVWSVDSVIDFMNVCSSECECSLGWLEALCQHLHHLHSKTKQGSLRCAPCMKCAPCQKTQHRAFRNCHLIKFFRCRFWSLSRDTEKYLGQFVQPTPSQMISWERLTHIYVKPWLPPPPFFFSSNDASRV